MKRTFIQYEGIAQLTGPERSVMAVLTEGMSTRSVVRVAADLYGRGDTDEGFTFGDPVGFVAWVLEALNNHGYVTYFIDDPRSGGNKAVPFAGLPYNIRLTSKGWAAMGYARYVTEIGTRGAHFREVRGGDLTDYHNHDYHAEGGPISRHDWWQCPRLFPAPQPRKETTMAEQELVLRDDVRTYLKVTPELESRVTSAYARTGSYAKTAAETNLDERRVRYIVNDRPRLKRDASSLKERVLETIREKGPYVDSMALHRDMPGSHGLHNLVHILHSLNKAALIEYRTEKKGGATNYVGIRVREGKLASNGAHPVDGTSMSVDTEAYGTDMPSVTPELAPTPELGPTYPLLESLTRIRKETEEGRTKASHYITAAEEIGAIDPDMAERLLQKAADIDGPALSPVEQEYLAYAAEHP